MRSRSVWLTACSVVALAGCGGEKRHEPALPAALARRLQLLEPKPRALRALAIKEVNAGHVPSALQEELLSSANAYAENPTPARRRALDELLR